MKRVIIVGSPRSNGRSAHVAEMLFEANIDERPEDELFLVPVSEIEVGPCIGCNACRKPTEVLFVDDDGAERTELRPRCVFDDDMQTLYDLLDDADQVTVVSPVYFSGAPAMLKCLLDRLQPYFWADTRKAPKRPAELHVLGEGGDPHGFDSLVSEVKSSFACAGFRLERVFDWVGKVTPEGEITAEAREITLPVSPNHHNTAAASAAPDHHNPSSATTRTRHDAASSPNRHNSPSTNRHNAAASSTNHHNPPSPNHHNTAAASVASDHHNPSSAPVGAQTSAPANRHNTAAPAKKQRPKLDLSATRKKGKRRG